MAEQLPEAKQRISQALIDAYAELSGDHNPIHVDPEVAARSEFGGTIAHGPMALQPFIVAATTLLAAETLPSGSRFRIRYMSPMRPGDEVGCRLAERDGDVLVAECVKQDGTVVARVDATIPGAGARLEGAS